MSERTLKVGDAVICVDGKGREAPGLVTAIHGGEVVELNDKGTEVAVKFDIDAAPCINVAFVSHDQQRQDGWGRQIERESSFVHRSYQQAGGMYWRFEDEEPLPMVTATT